VQWTNDDLAAYQRAHDKATTVSTASATPETGLRFETTIRAREVREAVGRSYWRIFFGLGLITFGIQTLFRLQRPWRDSWDLITDLISYVVGITIGMLAFGFGILFFSSSRLARRSEANGPTRYLVTDDGLDIRDEAAEAKLKWQAFAGFVEKKTLILLRLRQTRKLLIVPKRCLASSVEHELITTLSNKLARLRA
jgi:hypothetical protein